jgi:hypothetical protein
MESRIAAGVAFPSDARAGFELGRRIALKEIEATSGFVPKTAWDGKMPTQAGLWVGKKPMLPMAGQYKTVVLDSGSQFSSTSTSDFAKDMEELKKFKQTFRSTSNAYFWGSQPFWEDQLAKKLFEQNLHLNPPRAARIYALTAITIYDAFTACWDAKYTYWGIRPSQYDTKFSTHIVFQSAISGYPSGHAVISGAVSELYSYFFPADKAFFPEKS